MERTTYTNTFTGCVGVSLWATYFQFPVCSNFIAGRMSVKPDFLPTLFQQGLNSIRSPKTNQLTVVFLHTNISSHDIQLYVTRYIVEKDYHIFSIALCLASEKMLLGKDFWPLLGMMKVQWLSIYNKHLQTNTLIWNYVHMYGLILTRNERRMYETLASEPWSVGLTLQKVHNE